MRIENYDEMQLYDNSCCDNCSVELLKSLWFWEHRIIPNALGTVQQGLQRCSCQKSLLIDGTASFNFFYYIKESRHLEVDKTRRMIQTVVVWSPTWSFCIIFFLRIHHISNGMTWLPWDYYQTLKSERSNALTMGHLISFCRALLP